jgi:hypothetical protein
MSGFTRVAQASIGSVGSNWQVARVADYDGDGQSGILWHNPGTGKAVMWRISGLSRSDFQSIGSVTAGWRVQ